MKKQVLFLVICVFLSAILIGCENEKKEEKPVIENTVAENTNVEQEETQNVPEEKIEEVSLASEYGAAVENCLRNTRHGVEVYSDCMAEFDDVNDAPKDYLAVCTSSRAWHNDASEDIYQAKVPFSDFNKALVELFGDEANGLIEESDLESVFYVDKNEDGTYHFNGWGPSDTFYATCFIKDITKQGNDLKAEVVEYKVEYSESSYDMEPGKDYDLTIYDMNSNEITKLVYRLDSESGMFATYDAEGNAIESLDDYLLNTFPDKVSIRTIEYKYDPEDGTAIMLRNSFNK